MKKTAIVSAGLLCLAIFAAGAAADDSEGPIRKLFKKDKEESKPKTSSSFGQFWYDSKADWERLKKISVPAVDASKLSADPAWQAAGDVKAAQYAADSQKLAEFMKDSFCEELKARAGKSWQLTGEPDEETAVLQLTLTKITPPKDPFAPSQVQSEESQQSIAMEGKLIDKKTGAEIMRFSDSKPLGQGDPGVWYGNAKYVMKGWADSFAEMSMPDAKEESSSKGPFRKIGRMIGLHFGLRKFMQ